MNFLEQINRFKQFRAYSGLSLSIFSVIDGMYRVFRSKYANNQDNYECQQEYLDEWAICRKNESNSSQCSRVNKVNLLLRYINEKELGNFKLLVPLRANRSKEPVLFDEKELRNFLKACDETAVEPCTNKLVFLKRQLKAIETPVVFRLLYSTGMRNYELRNLKTEDVDLSNSIIRLKCTKGGDNRFIVLHPSVCSMLEQYENLVSKLMPGRSVYFPNHKDEIRNKSWLSQLFRERWNIYNAKTGTVTYSLRHNYVIENINKMPSQGHVVDKKILALSKSLGHKKLESTLYYYHLTPRFSDIYDAIMNDKLDKIIP